MKLKDLISLEEKLLKIELVKIFDLHINDVILLKDYLRQIGDITSTYFNLVQDYSKKVAEEYAELSYEDKKKKLEEYNSRLLNGEVYTIINEKDILGFIEKFHVYIYNENN
jgi:hypothetical protein